MLYSYVSIAHHSNYCVVIVEPKTSWKYNITDCALKNHHEVTENILQEQLSKFQQIYAIYYGWFPSEENSRTLKDSMFKMFRECLAKINSFNDFLVENNQQDEQGKFIICFFFCLMLHCGLAVHGTHYSHVLYLPPFPCQGGRF